MTEKKRGREIVFVETYDEDMKGTVEKTLLKHGISYLIKVDKVREVKRGRLESRKKFSFYINRYQEEEARAAMQESGVKENKAKEILNV